MRAWTADEVIETQCLIARTQGLVIKLAGCRERGVDLDAVTTLRANLGRLTALAAALDGAAPESVAARHAGRVIEVTLPVGPHD